MLLGDHSHFGPLLCLLINPLVPLTYAGFQGAPLVLYMRPASSVAYRVKGPYVSGQSAAVESR